MSLFSVQAADYKNTKSSQAADYKKTKSSVPKLSDSKLSLGSDTKDSNFFSRSKNLEFISTSFARPSSMLNIG